MLQAGAAAGEVHEWSRVNGGEWEGLVEGAIANRRSDPFPSRPPQLRPVWRRVAYCAGWRCRAMTAAAQKRCRAGGAEAMGHGYFLEAPQGVGAPRLELSAQRFLGP